MNKIVYIFFFFLIFKLDLFAGNLSGKVTESGTNASVVGATVKATNLQTQEVKGTFTDMKGNYQFKNLNDGEYTVTASSIGYKFFETNLNVSGSVSQNFSLEIESINLDAVVTSASRKQEKVLEAPASVSVIGTREIALRPTLAPTDHLRGVVGVDIAQTGLMQQNLVVRGFNNVFSGQLTMLTDNRIASVPSLRVNVPYMIAANNEDIERIEVVRGPASALYGPNASQGVVNMITRSPFSSQGTTLSLGGGTQGMKQASFRHASVVSEKFGYKISGQYFKGKELEHVDDAEVKDRIPDVEKYSSEIRFDYLASNGLSSNVTAGITKLVSGIELTALGAAQGKNWGYSFVQGRVSYNDLFLQTFLNVSDAGETYMLRTGEELIDKSKQFVMQAQNSYDIMNQGKHKLIYGLDFIKTFPNTEGTIMGRNEKDDNISEFGVYVQSENHLMNNKFDLIFAGRYDKHNRLNDAVISPRVAFVYHHDETSDFRLTYNQAYSTPSTNDLFLDLLAEANPFGYPDIYAIPIRATGVPTTGFNFEKNQYDGYDFNTPFYPVAIPTVGVGNLWPVVVDMLIAQNSALLPLRSTMIGNTPTGITSALAILNPNEGKFDPVSAPQNIEPLKPTINRTIEFGYKGFSMNNKLELGVDIYSSKMNNFIGRFQVFTPNVFMTGVTKEYFMQFGLDSSTSIALSQGVSGIPLGTITPKEAVDKNAIMVAPRNFGEINILGIDFALNYKVNNNLEVSGTFSTVNENYFEKLDGDFDLSMNAPKKRGTVSVKYISGFGLSAEVRNRWNDGFYMSSGVYIGDVEKYSLYDINLNYKLSPIGENTILSVSVLNAFDKAHNEFIGAPKIGRMVIAKLNYTL